MVLCGGVEAEVTGATVCGTRQTPALPAPQCPEPMEDDVPGGSPAQGIAWPTPRPLTLQPLSPSCIPFSPAMACGGAGRAGRERWRGA